MKLRIIVFVLVLQTLAACAPIEPQALSGATPPPSAMTGSGRVPGAPARIPTPSESDLRGTRGVSISMTHGGDGLLVQISSETGIGNAQIVLPTVAEELPVTVRLHLRGLEEWRFTFANLTTVGSVNTGDGAVRQAIVIDDQEAQPIDEGSPYWMQVAPAQGEGPFPEAFDLTLPSAFRESGLNTFTLSFIDFYR